MKVKIGEYNPTKGELGISVAFLIGVLYGDETIESSRDSNGRLALYSLSKSFEERDKHNKIVKSLSDNSEVLNKILRQYYPTYEYFLFIPFIQNVLILAILEKLNVESIKKLTICGKPDLVVEIESRGNRYKLPFEVKLLKNIFDVKKSINQAMVYSFIFTAPAFILLFSQYNSKLVKVIHIPYSFEVQKNVEKMVEKAIKKLNIPGAGFEPATSRFL